MKTKEEHLRGFVYKNIVCNRGNALVYILIAIALFASLSFTLSRQAQNEEGGDLENERAQFYATQISNYAAQAQSAIDQMIFVGARVDDLDFVLPGEPAFEEGEHIDKVFHPEGGGLNLEVLAPAMVQENPRSEVPPGWYMGRFNNVGWTVTERPEVVLTAYQISRPVCERINQMVSGPSEIPVLREKVESVLIDGRFSGVANIDLTTGTDGVCPACENRSALCVQSSDRRSYAFYVILKDQ